MKLRLATFTVVVAAAVLLLGGVCGRRLYPPQLVEVPNSVYAGDPAAVKLIASGRGYESVLYVVNWDDGVVDTSEPYTPDDVATMWHVWADTGTRQVRAAVFSPDDPQGIRWGNQRSVDVEAGGSHAPVIDSVKAPPLAIEGIDYFFAVEAHDPDGDSIRICVDWGDGNDTISEQIGGPHFDEFYPRHAFARVGSSRMIVSAQDQAGATSLPETILVPVDTTGGVIWYHSGPLTSPFVVNDGVEDCIYFRPGGGFYPPGPAFLAFAEDGAWKYAAATSPLAAAAYCAATQHVVGWGGQLQALDRQLHLVWTLGTSDSVDYSRWTDPAVGGNRVYLGGKESLFCFIDSVDHGVRAAAYAARGAIADAPVIDEQGAVYFGTDSGYLYKVGTWLDTTFWSVHLAANRIHSPVVGSDGTIYCTSESQSIYAIDPATGTALWTAVLDGQALRPAAGKTAIFVGTTASKVYSINPATGGINWAKVLGYPGKFTTAPAIAADGTVYFQNDGDVLYRVNQTDGTVVWQCDCSGFYEGYWGTTYAGKGELPNWYPANPTILSNGNVIVAGVNALYCVAGSRAGPLDPLAPWPKWQHDLYNTGSVAGGR